MQIDDDILLRKLEHEKIFEIGSGPRDTNDYLSIIRHIDRNYCGIVNFRWPGVKTPIYMRCGSSDLSNFIQVFCNEEYGFQVDAAPARILDLGGYVGYAAIYLATRFPHAKIMSIEPSSANFQILTLNTSAYSHIRTMNVGVWGHDAVLNVASNSGGDWANRLVETTADDHTIRALSFMHILNEAGWDYVDFLKCDIEGAELSLFAEAGLQISSKVRCCAIEIHDLISPGASQVVGECFARSKFGHLKSGEFEVFTRFDATLPAVPPQPRVSLLRPAAGVRKITLIDVPTDSWGYYIFDVESCQLHPRDHGQVPAGLSMNVELAGQTDFETEVEVVNPLGFSVNFSIQVVLASSEVEIIHSSLTVAAGDRRKWTVPLGTAAWGKYRVLLQTIMSETSPTSHQARANWIAPCFMG